MRVLVLGASGFIGSEIARALLARDVAVVGLREFVDVFSRDLRDGAKPAPLALVATDCDWSAILFGSAPAVGSDVIVPSLELRGSASDILLSLWGRVKIDDPALADTLGAIDLS